MTAGGLVDPLSIVVTGGTGFVGQRLLRDLAGESPALQVAVLGRQAGPPSVETTARRPAWRSIAADLADPGSLDSSALPEGATVIHLAAATGRASPAQMHAVNVEGTRRLLAAARQQAVRHFIFVSSVAVGFPDRRWYHYAQSKAEAEALVRASPVPWTILRPTMVFGKGSPNERALWGLACGPVPMVLGTGRVRLQPVHVDDVAAALVRLVHQAPVGDVVSIGGRDVVTMSELLAAMRSARGLASRRPLPVPLGTVRAVLGALEPILRSWFPVSAGQLAAFVNDSVAGPSPGDIVRRLMPEPRSLTSMLDEGAPARG